jgi:hypothetical protein
MYNSRTSNKIDSRVTTAIKKKNTVMPNNIQIMQAKYFMKNDYIEQEVFACYLKIIIYIKIKEV